MSSVLKIHWPVSVIRSTGRRENDEWSSTVDCIRNRSFGIGRDNRVLSEKIIASHRLETEEEVLVILIQLDRRRRHGGIPEAVEIFAGEVNRGFANDLQ